MGRKRWARHLYDAARYSAAGPRSVRYVGWVGHRNLGDEALYQAIGSYFRPARLVHHERAGFAPLDTLAARRQRAGMLVGGGTLIGSSYLKEIASLSERHPRWCVVFGSGVVSQSFGEQFPGRHTPTADWAELLGSFRYVGVRGPDSQSALEAVGVNAEMLGDPVAAFTREESFWDPKERHIGVNIGLAGGRMWGREADVMESFASLLQLAGRAGFTVECFVVWPADLKPTLAVLDAAGLGDVPVHRTYNSAERYQDLVSRMQAFIGIKLHATALALAAGVPSVMLEYRPKCLDFMRSIGSEAMSLRTDRFDAGSALTLLEESLETGAVQRDHVRRRFEGFRDLQSRRASELAMLLPVDSQ